MYNYILYYNYHNYNNIPIAEELATYCNCETDNNYYVRVQVEKYAINHNFSGNISMGRVENGEDCDML